MSVAGQAMDERIVEEAIRWQAAISRGDCDWDAFTLWLEADPAHRSSFDEISRIEDLASRHRGEIASLLSQPAPQAPARRPGMFVAGLAAVAVIAALAVGWRAFDTRGAPAPAYRTMTGTSQNIALLDGSRVTLAGNSRLQVSGRQQDHMSLQGAAYFDVPHDPRRMLQIQAGDFLLADIGTRFEVLSGPGVLQVSVAEGAVSVQSSGVGQPLKIQAGQRLLITGDPARAEYANIEPAEVANWREGQLVFRNEPLAVVALQISRHSGVNVTVDPAIAGRRFSGVLMIGDGSQLVARLEEIMGLAGQKQGGSVRLSSAPAGP